LSDLSPEELQELRRFHVQLGRRSDSLFSGDYQSVVRGRGMEFEEVRSYAPGDDIRHIDWNVTARAGEPYTKLFREERQVTVMLVVDVSGSTQTGSGGRDGRTDRRLQIARIAGGLAFSATRHRDHVGLLTFTDRVEEVVRPRRSKGHAWAIIRKIFGANPSGRGTNVSQALQHLHSIQRRRCVVIVVSDFLDDGPWQKALSTVARKHDVHAVLVNDPLEEGLARLGLVEACDAESGRTVLLDGASWDPEWTLEARLQSIRRAGAKGLAISTLDDPLRSLRRHFSGRVRP